MSLTKQDLADIRGVVVDAINESFEVLSAPRFDALESRMGGLEGRMDGLEGRMDRLEGRMDSLDGRMDGLDGQMNSQTIGILETNRTLRSVVDRLDAIEADIKRLKNDVMALYQLTATPILPAFSKTFDKLSNEDKVRTLHAHTLALAKQLNIEL